MKKKKIIKILLVIFWMGVIFTFSNQKATDSSKLSYGFIKNTIAKTFNINDDEKLKKFVKPIRKTAHFTIYLILGLLVLNCFDVANKKTIIYTVIICLLYSISDEIHQMFIDGRSGEVVDVFIDTLGSFSGSLIYKFWTYKK